MKKKFSKILGVGLTLALLTSLLLTAAPVSALTQPTVDVAPTTISADAVYTITFNVVKALAVGDEIVVTFPTGTGLANITAAVDGDVMVGASSGIGVGSSASTPSASNAPGTGLVLTITLPNAIGAGAMVQLVIGTAGPPNHIVNPDSIGDYTLTVATQTGATPPVVIEAAVTSAAYTIKAPVIPEVPGIVRGYNAAGIKLYEMTGATAIQDAINTAGVVTVEVSPGTYDEDIVVAVADAATTVKSTGGAVVTIIADGLIASGNVTIQKKITFDGFTVEGTVKVETTADSTIKNCVLKGSPALDIDIAATVDSCTIDTTGTAVTGIDVDAAATVTGSTFIVDTGGTSVDTAANLTLSGSTFTGSSGTGVNATGGISTISGSTFDSLTNAFAISGGTVTIKGNTIANSTGDAISVTAAVTEVTIFNNNINDTAETFYALNVAAAASGDVYMEFNNLVGNTLNVKGATAGTVVDATHNWWGAATGPATGSISGAAVDTSAYLGSSVSASDVDVGAPVTSLDAKTTVGVAVSGATAATTIAVAKYTANPQEAIADALAFYDVYVAGATANPLIKFYAGDENTELYIWSADTDRWVSQARSFSAYGGYVYATVDKDALTHTPFVLVHVPAVAPTLAAPGIVMPIPAAVDVSLTPTFDWAPVAGADAYYFQLADNPIFAPRLLMSFVGDEGRLIETAYTHVTPLEYNTAYHWRVKAVSGTIAAGDLAESAWSEHVFITMDEPVEVLPPVEVVEAPPITITLEPPDIIVPLPAVTPITPAWIYVIIAVGAVLVIALLILIVRTRRVA